MLTTAETRIKPHPRTFISADSKRSLLNIREIWAYRAVLWALVRREVQVRYAQTIAGAAWVILQPVLTTGVLTVLAGRWIGVPTDGIPYPLFAFTGLVPWLYFTHVLNKSSMCMLSTGLLSKAYFPRLLLPMASAIGALVDVAAAGGVLAIMAVHYGARLKASLLLLPACVLFLTIVSLGIGVWVAVLNLYYRDVAHALPFVTQLLLLLSPVAYSVSLVPPAWRLVYSLNPIAGVVEAWRYALIGDSHDFSLAELSISLLSGAAILLGGLWLMRWREPVLADVGES